MLMEIKQSLQKAFQAAKDHHDLVMDIMKNNNCPRELYEEYWEFYKAMDNALMEIVDATDVNPFPLPLKD
jgi:hypothetical protein